MRRGWPSGLEVSQATSPSNRHSRATRGDEVADLDLEPRPQVHGLGAVVALGGGQDPLGRVAGVQELARGLPGRPTPRSASSPRSRASTHLRTRAGMTWRALRVEVVARAVEVHREEHHGVEAVLLPVGLALHEQHLLGEAVGRVGLLRVAVPEVLLAERHRAVLGVGADGAERDQLLEAHLPAHLEELHAHHQVVVEELPRVVAVGADAAHPGRQVQDQRRPGVAVERAHRPRSGPGRSPSSGGRTRRSPRAPKAPRARTSPGSPPPR